MDEIFYKSLPGIQVVLKKLLHMNNVSKTAVSVLLLATAKVCEYKNLGG